MKWERNHIETIFSRRDTGSRETFSRALESQHMCVHLCVGMYICQTKLRERKWVSCMFWRQYSMIISSWSQWFARETLKSSTESSWREKRLQKSCLSSWFSFPASSLISRVSPSGYYSTRETNQSVILLSQITIQATVHWNINFNCWSTTSMICVRSICEAIQGSEVVMAAGKRNSGDGGGGHNALNSMASSPLWPVVIIEDQISSAITTAVTSAIKHLAITLSTSSHLKSPLSQPPSTEDQLPKKSVQDDLKEYSLQEVAEHCLPNDCWIVLFDKIYDVTDFLSEHPGGEFIILESAGRDATLAFRGTRHGKDSYDSLAKYLVGILPESERIYSGQEIDCWRWPLIYFKDIETNWWTQRVNQCPNHSEILSRLAV